MQNTLQSLVSLSLIGGAALWLCPDSGVRHIIRILCSALLAAAILTPLAGFDYGRVSFEQARFSSAEAELSRKADTTENELRQILLRENCERYIGSQGESCGLVMKNIEVELRKSDDGQWLPYRASIRAAGDEAEAERLRGLIRDELGIPAERQVWSLNE